MTKSKSKKTAFIRSRMGVKSPNLKYKLAEAPERPEAKRKRVVARRKHTQTQDRSALHATHVALPPGCVFITGSHLGPTHLPGLPCSPAVQSLRRKEDIYKPFII